MHKIVAKGDRQLNGSTVVTNHMIAYVSEYSNVLASVSNVSFYRSMLSFAPTLQDKLTSIIGSVYLQAYNNNGTEFIMDKSVMSSTQSTADLYS